MGAGLEPDHKNVKRLFESLEIHDDNSANAAVPKATSPAPKHPALGPTDTAPPPPPKDQPPPAPKEQAKTAPEPPPDTPAPGNPPAEVKSKPVPGLIAELELPKDAGTALAAGFSHLGKTLAVGTMFGQALWYDPANGKLHAAGKTRMGERMDGCAISPESDKVAFFRESSTVLYFDRAAPEEEVLLFTDKLRRRLVVKGGAFSPDGAFLTTGHGDDITRVWDLAGRKLARKLEGFRGLSMAAPAYRPDGSLLACADRDVLLWDPKDFDKAPVTLKGAREALGFSFSRLAFSPDGKRLAAVTDRTLSVWELGDTPDPAAMPRQHRLSDSATSLLFNSDGRLLLVGGARRQGNELVRGSQRGGYVQVLDAETFMPRGELKADKFGGEIVPLAFRRDSDELAVARGNSVLLIDLNKALAE